MKTEYKVGDLVQRNEAGLKYKCWHEACKYAGIDPTDVVVVTSVTEGGIGVKDKNGKSLRRTGSFWLKECFSPAVERIVVECTGDD